jgi:hypothetical protein
MKSTAAIAAVLTAASIVLATPPEMPKTPAAVDDLVYARPFTLETGFKYIWSKERPNVTDGTLLVLKVDKALVVPRSIATPVLYVGDQPAQRVNQGHESGHVIAVVPGEVDLTKVPIWFGSPGFPFDTDAATARAERARAEEAGIEPFAEKRVTAARGKGGAPIRKPDMSALLRDELAELILEYCPGEKKLADDFRVPVVTKQKQARQAADGE